MIITLQNHCKSPPFASNTDYTTKEVNCLGAIPPTTLEVGESLLNHVEEIRRGYGVDNADADGAFAELCETYCANKGRFCYAECEKYHCKNFKWRGIKED